MPTSANILDDIWNKAEGVFDRVIDFEFTKKEFDLFKEAKAFQANQDNVAIERREGNAPSVGNGFGLDRNTTLMALAAGGVLLFFALRK